MQANTGDAVGVGWHREDDGFGGRGVIRSVSGRSVGNEWSVPLLFIALFDDIGFGDAVFCGKRTQRGSLLIFVPDCLPVCHAYSPITRHNASARPTMIAAR